MKWEHKKWTYVEDNFFFYFLIQLQRLLIFIYDYKVVSIFLEVLCNVMSISRFQVRKRAFSNSALFFSPIFRLYDEGYK